MLSQPPREQSSWESQRKQCFLPSKLPTIQQLIGAGELHRRGTKTSRKPPASGKVVRDEQQEGSQRAASLPAQCCVPHHSKVGTADILGQGTASEAEQLTGWFSITCHTHPVWGHLGTWPGHHSCCNLLPVLDMGPDWSKLGVRALITNSSWRWGMCEFTHTRTYIHTKIHTHTHKYTHTHIHTGLFPFQGQPWFQ